MNCYVKFRSDLVFIIFYFIIIVDIGGIVSVSVDNEGFPASVAR